MGKSNFVIIKKEVNGVPYSGGIVLCANGELCDPDCRTAISTNNIASNNEWLETWNEVAEDAAVLSWEWRHGRYYFSVILRPEVVTHQMLDAAKRLYHEIVSIHAGEIDWADMCLWRCNPTGAPGWSLEAKPVLTTEELCAMVEAANRRLEAIPDSAYERPHATLHHSESGWYICTDSDFGKCDMSPLLNASVESFLQQERDYLCHHAVAKSRQEQREDYAEKYESYRSAINQPNSALVDVGADGFCLIVDGVSEIYGLNEGDFQLFIRYIEELKSSGTTSQKA